MNGPPNRPSERSGAAADLRARGALLGVALVLPAMILYAAFDVPPLPFAESRVSPWDLLLGAPWVVLLLVLFPVHLPLPALGGFLLGRRRERAGATRLGAGTIGALFVIAFASIAIVGGTLRALDG